VQERALVAGSLAAITGFLVAGLTEYSFGDSEVVMVAWTIMAVPFVVGGRVPLAEPSSPGAGPGERPTSGLKSGSKTEEHRG
jgi:hypothetical protein